MPHLLLYALKTEMSSSSVTSSTSPS